VGNHTREKNMTQSIKFKAERPSARPLDLMGKQLVRFEKSNILSRDFMEVFIFTVMAELENSPDHKKEATIFVYVAGDDTPEILHGLVNGDLVLIEAEPAIAEAGKTGQVVFIERVDSNNQTPARKKNTKTICLIAMLAVIVLLLLLLSLRLW